jgi:hypothetical protein
MNMLSREFKRSLYSPTGLVDLGSRLVTCAGETVEKDPNGAIVKDSLKAALGDLVIASEREKANPVTQAIRGKDAVRDNHLCMIRDTIKANTRNEESGEKREAAVALYRTFRLHAAKINRMGNADESAAVKFLVENMLAGENRAKSEQLGLVPVIEALVRTQTELDELYAERSRLAPELEKVNITRSMKETANAIQAFLGFVDVLVTANAAGSAELRDQVSHILKEVESIARGRKTRLQNDEPDQPAQVLNKAA